MVPCSVHVAIISVITIASSCLFLSMSLHLTDNTDTLEWVIIIIFLQLIKLFVIKQAFKLHNTLFPQANASMKVKGSLLGPTMQIMLQLPSSTTLRSTNIYIYRFNYKSLLPYVWVTKIIAITNKNKLHIPETDISDKPGHLITKNKNNFSGGDWLNYKIKEQNYLQTTKSVIKVSETTAATL